MNYLLRIFWAIFILTPSFLFGQERGEILGNVSFKSSTNVYVRFENTSDININDTLLILEQSIWVPALVVIQKSTTSCVTQNISSTTINLGQAVKKIVTKKVLNTLEPVISLPIEEIKTNVTLDSLGKDSISITKSRKSITTGRLTLSTNASINPDQQNNFQRIRAAVSLNVQNINESAFSIQTYLTYRRRYGIDQTNYNFYNDFKVLSLAMTYSPSDRLNISLGRRMNQNIANIGAIDGLQGEYIIGKYTIGGILGTRPDFTNFTFNAGLPQVGLYLVRSDNTTKGLAQTSLAIVEQQNDFKTDRRFLYFQHNNSIVKNLNIFFSTEFDLFKKVNGETDNKPRLTSVYASLRYRLRRNLSVSGSYDNRRNIIYYESYQTFIEQLLAQETRQGFRLQANYSPFRRININVSSFYRYQGSIPKPTKNHIVNLSISSIARKSTNLSLNYNQLESYTFTGNIIGGRINDSFFKGKLSTEINYRQINYNFFNSESALKQKIAGINFTINVLKKTTLMCSYEGTFEPTKAWHRYFVTVTQRIKN
jgi:hypothetical protein